MAEISTDIRPNVVPNGKSSRASSPKQKLHSNGNRVLPPGWERLHSEQGVYYWNKRTGKTTWKFPEDEAKEHNKVVRAHTYVNVKPGRKQKSNSPLTKSAASQSHAESTHPAKRGVASDNKEHGEGGVMLNGVGSVVSGQQEKGEEGIVATASSASSHLPNGHSGTGSPKSSPSSNSPPHPPKEHHYENIVLKDGKPHPQKNTSSPTSEGDTASDPQSFSGPESPPAIPERRYCESEVCSPPPPLPERHYADSDVSMTPPPPIPERFYESSSDTDIKSLTDQQQQEGDKNGDSSKSGETFATGAQQEDGSHSSQTEDDVKTATSGEDTVQPLRQPRVVQRKVAPMGDEYALVERTWKKGTKGRPASLSEGSTSDVSLPENTTVASEQDKQGQEQKEPSPQAANHQYADIDHNRVVNDEDPFNDPVAYAVVKLDQLVENKVERRMGSPVLPREIQPEPEPYETPVPSPRSTLNRDMAFSGPYEEVDFPDSTSQASDNSFMVVNHEVQKRLAVLQLQRHGDDGPSSQLIVNSTLAQGLPHRRLASTPPPLPKRSLGDGGNNDSRRLASTPPPLPKRSLGDVGNSDSRGLTSTPPPLSKRTLVDGSSNDPRDSRDLASTPPPLSKHDGSNSDPGDNRELTSTPPPLPKRVAVHGGDEEARNKRVRSPMQSKAKLLNDGKLDSLFDQREYNFPANNRRLQSLNITLRRPSQGEDPQGCSKLDLSKQALLLRSGVTLRRVRSSTSPLVSPRGPLEEEESSTEEDGSTEEEENGLEPVNKCIRSLQNSLRLKGTDPDEYGKMQKVPAGPPKWHEFRRKPHLYEEVTDKRGTLTPSPSKSLSNLDEPDMDWDESDFMTAQAPVRKKELSMSTSQPNLLRVSGDLDNVFPHLKKPARVSEEAFYLRKLRLLQHCYEDIDIPEWKQVGRDEVGNVEDVNALMSAIRASWLESDKRTPPPGEEKLPKGWKRMTDEGGNLYYWHVPTGRTQYTRPTGEELRRLSLSSLDHSWEDEAEGSKLQREKSPPPSQAERQKTKAPTFMARYLGDSPVAESELIPGQCVKVVHSCIKQMTESKWKRKSSSHCEEKGRVLFLQVQGMDLKWLDPETCNAITVQPINKIRVWGIGLENEKEFGYVARDPKTQKHKCHVFRCDMPARAVARALLESHQREKGRLRESPLTTSGSSMASTCTISGESGVQSTTSSSSDAMTESTALMAGRRGRSPLSTNTSSSSGAMRGGSDRYTRIACTYVGSCEVSKAVGMAVLNEAVDKLSTPAQQSYWIDVNVDIATSHIKITDIKTDRVIREHRVRFLCFLGIGKDDRYCGYIIDSGEKGGEKRFQFHGFKMEPNTDQLCLCLHSACQARYQRVMDANPEAVKKREEESKEKEKQERVRSKSSASLLDKLQGSFRKTKKEEEPKSDSFVVQYLGSLPVAKKEGVETVKEPVKQLAILKSSPTHSTIPHLVEFEVSTSGISITDPQKRLFSKKNFNVKNITYVVRIKSYFAFIVRESGKYHCHVFLESEVDAATIVISVQNFLAPEQKQQKK